MNPHIRLSFTALVSAMVLALSAPVWSQASSFAEPQAQILRAAPGQALAVIGSGTPASAVATSMRNRGANDATAQSLVAVSSGQSKFGRTHVQLEQQVGGLTVYGSSVKAAFTNRGELVHVIEKLAAVPASASAAASINERQALDAAMARVHPGVQANFVPGPRVGQTQRFSGGAFFHNDPEVTRVLVPQANGSLAQGFLVQTWTQAGNLLDHTLVGGDGAVLKVERRTASDSYRVFVEDPAKTPQAIVVGPAPGGASPLGWLFAGAQNTIDIDGNNVSAYLDASNNNRPDRGGTTVTSGDFLTVANLAVSPTTTGNREVAVQNLFYLNNVIHDILYGHGFNEAAGNFQINNFGNGGADKDPVNAEAQDGSGTDNANFATPTDGKRPRMQMYLWTGAGFTHEVAISGGPIYDALGAAFGPTLTTTGETGDIVFGNDGVAGGTVTDGCEALPSSIRGKIVLFDRGFCNFTVKVQNAQRAGAAGVIIANNTASPIFTMGGDANGLHIPAVMISQADGASLRLLATPVGTMRMKAVLPLQIDASLDSDVVFHEYGHGLTWRMIGGMSGPLAGAIGEGASDTVAFMVNGDDRIAEYSASNAGGIRRAPYSGYPLKYSNVTGAEVHNDGEIYAAAMWHLRELWVTSGRATDLLFDHFVDGMNYTPSTPAFEHMRNGMLEAIAATAGGDAVARCTLVWQAFADYEIGDGASGTVLTSTTVAITPSTATRSDCTH